MKGIRLLPILLVLGCATTQDISYLDYRILNLEGRLERLEQGHKETAKRIEEIRGGMEAPLASLRADLEALKTRVEQVAEDQKAKGELLQGLLVKIGELERKLSELEAKAPPEAKSPAKEEPLNPEELYNEAFLAFRQGDLEGARARFSQFLAKFPDHELSDNAQFWLGECYYKEGDYEKAILEYEKVLSRYPKGNKVPAALLKEGLAFLALGDELTGRYLLERLLKEFPSSPEADLAREKLKALPRKP